jgi:hypothetical protein
MVLLPKDLYTSLNLLLLADFKAFIGCFLHNDVYISNTAAFIRR